MQWTDVTKAPPARMLRQFAGLWLVVFLGMATWRWWHGRVDIWTQGLALAAVVVGGAGLWRPALVGPIWTAWMIAAFPIGWTVSRVALGIVFFLVVTPVALVFRAIGRDALRLRRVSAGTYWIGRASSRELRTYFRQS